MIKWFHIFLQHHKGKLHNSGNNENIEKVIKIRGVKSKIPMDRIQKAIFISIISTAVISWVLSKDQPDMMKAMMTYDPIAISLFAASWTVGMAAMMFPAITPMVLLYNRLINRDNNAGDGREDIKTSSQSAIVIEGNDKGIRDRNRPLFANSANMILFVGSYLVVWATTGIALLLAWSIPMNYFFIHLQSNHHQQEQSQQQLQFVYGIILIISGVYQFSSLKRKCLGYCESPLSFFMRRWRSGTIGAVKMGTYHGLYCLGCCWPYFLLMVALGWMNLLWMGLFAGIIFGEKIWCKGIWIARCVGIGLAIVGMMTIIGMMTIPTMHMGGDGMNGDSLKKDSMIGMNHNMNDNLMASNMDMIKKGITTTIGMQNMKGM
jgi:predicted metal-binding membrane protein